MTARPDLDDVEALRGALTGYCYRLLGAHSDAEDAVQETMIRAYRNLDSYDPGRARLTTWVHRIAHNVCVDSLRSARRRAQPMGLSLEAVLGAPLGEPLPDDHWVEPMPDSRVLTAADPAARLIERESVRLAFVAALQYLSAVQRSVLVLRDVLHFSAAETAVVVGCSTAAVNSSLQRARARLRDLKLEPAEVYDPTDDAQRDLLDRYVRAFENHDVNGLMAILHSDATTSMPPFAWWLRGGRRIARLMASSESCAGARLRPTVVGGLPGFGQYRPDQDGGHGPFALMQVQTRGGLIADIVTFLGTAGRFTEFGLPARI